MPCLYISPLVEDDKKSAKILWLNNKLNFVLLQIFLLRFSIQDFKAFIVPYLIDLSVNKLDAGYWSSRLP